MADNCLKEVCLPNRNWLGKLRKKKNQNDTNNEIPNLNEGKRNMKSVNGTSMHGEQREMVTKRDEFVKMA